MTAEIKTAHQAFPPFRSTYPIIASLKTNSSTTGPTKTKVMIPNGEYTMDITLWALLSGRSRSSDKAFIATSSKKETTIIHKDSTYV